METMGVQAKRRTLGNHGSTGEAPSENEFDSSGELNEGRIDRERGHVAFVFGSQSPGEIQTGDGAKNAVIDPRSPGPSEIFPGGVIVPGFQSDRQERRKAEIDSASSRGSESGPRGVGDGRRNQECVRPVGDDRPRAGRRLGQDRVEKDHGADRSEGLNFPSSERDLEFAVQTEKDRNGSEFASPQGVGRVRRRGPGDGTEFETIGAFQPGFEISESGLDSRPAGEEKRRRGSDKKVDGGGRFDLIFGRDPGSGRGPGFGEMQGRPPGERKAEPSGQADFDPFPEFAGSRSRVDFSFWIPRGIRAAGLSGSGRRREERQSQGGADEICGT